MFIRFQTQWRYGMNGPVGLDYRVIQHDLERRNLALAEYDEMMNAIRVIEAGALEAMHDE